MIKWYLDITNDVILLPATFLFLYLHFSFNVVSAVNSHVLIIFKENLLQSSIIKTYVFLSVTWYAQTPECVTFKTYTV